MHDELHHLGFLADREIGGGITFIPTRKGRVAARDTRAEYRPEAARRAVLSYLAAHTGELSGFKGLEDSEWADEPDGRLTAVEIRLAVDGLEDRGFIRGPQRTGGGELPYADITSRGRDYLRRKVPADVVTGGTSAGATHYSTTTTTTITGDNNQVAAGTRGPVTQHLSIVDNSATVTAGYENIAQLVGELVDQRLPLLRLKEGDRKDVIDEAEVVLGEVVKDEPDRKIIRRALSIIRGAVSAALTGVNQAVTDESAELAQATIDQISSSGFF
ncbi:hypothetical protein CYJ73_21310 [Gordonia terrae]|uniref:Uncharacterized protein n=1 Tax=Gordonia terrae TaxID=2055 RepID=A0A2I1R3A7_9ACTN|nr:hypothetical protein [Gordonia terrae]PKZ63600.1 hypothetical protein CYJ73_21310 [Gordonia terrae]